MTEAAYSSSHPDVTSWWAQLHALNAEYNQAARWFHENYPEHKVMEVHSRWGRGLSGLSGANPGPAWRVGKHGTWVPLRNHRKDPALLARYQAARIEYPPMPGMPADVMVWPTLGGFNCKTPGWREMGGEVWVTWGCTHDLVEESNRFDPTLWMRRRLSEYYAAVEQQEPAA